MSLHIAPDAAILIKRILSQDRAEHVLTISQSSGPVAFGSSEEEILEKVGKIVNDPNKSYLSARLIWTIGFSLRSRFPADQIVYADGIPCFIPDDLESVIDGRTVTLVDGELRIEPTPET